MFKELCEIVEETIADIHADGDPLPRATSGRDLISKLQDVA